MITVNTYTPVPYASVATDLKVFVRVEGTADDALLELLWLAAQEEWISLTHNYVGEASITWLTYGSWPVSLPYYPVDSITRVDVDDVQDTEFTTDTRDARYIVEPSVRGDKVQISFIVSQELNNEIKLALFQHVKFAYDFGDNLPADKVRYFDRIAMRYKQRFSA